MLKQALTPPAARWEAKNVMLVLACALSVCILIGYKAALEEQLVLGQELHARVDEARSNDEAGPDEACSPDAFDNDQLLQMRSRGTLGAQHPHARRYQGRTGGAAQVGPGAACEGGQAWQR